MIVNNSFMPLQHILEECIALQRHLREPELDIDTIVQHAEAVLRHARLAQEGASYATTSDRDRARVRAAFLRKIGKNSHGLGTGLGSGAPSFSKRSSH